MSRSASPWRTSSVFRSCKQGNCERSSLAPGTDESGRNKKDRLLNAFEADFVGESGSPGGVSKRQIKYQRLEKDTAEDSHGDKSDKGSDEDEDHDQDPKLDEVKSRKAEKKLTL